MSKRWRKIAIWAGSIIVVILIAGYFTINYAADKVLDSIADSALEEALSSQPADDGGAGNAVGGGPAEPADSATQGGGPSASAGASPSASGSSDSGVGASPQDSAGGSAQSPKPDDASGASGTPSAQPSPSSGDEGYTGEISVDQAEQVKDEISFSEKTKVMSVMLKRLSPSDIKTLSSLASGGLSVEEKKEAKDLILQKLSEKEYDELIAIAKKYGLSQGKSYADSQKELGQ